MANGFNPGVDSFSDDQILFFHPDKKRSRKIDNDIEPTDVDLLLKKLLDNAKSSLLTQLHDYLNQILEYFKLSGKLIALIILSIIGIFILELVLKYVFIYSSSRFRRMQLTYLKKLDADKPGQYFFKRRTKKINLKPSKQEIKQYLRCKQLVEEALFI